MKYFNYILLLAFSIGCTPEPKTDSINKYFDLPGFTQSLIKNQASSNRSVSKKSTVNSRTEKQIIGQTDSLFWTNELTFLLNSNLNIASLIDAYNIQENIPDSGSNLLKTIYTSLPESNGIVKKLEIKYLDDLSEVRQIIIEIENTNSVYSTQKKIRLWVNNFPVSTKEHVGQLKIDSIITTGFNKTIFLDSMIYSSVLVVQLE